MTVEKCNENNKNIISQKKWCFISFFAGAIVYYMFLSYSQMAGGKYIVLMSDALEGYISAIKWFCENLLDGKGLTYSWSSYLGINNYSVFSFIANIAMPVYLIFHRFDYAAITVIVLVIKAGLSSLFFFVFVNRILKIKEINCLFFSILYALCGFQIAYIPVLLQFSDAIFMLPLILYLVSIYADQGKFKIMCVAYLYLFLNFYYSAYIVGFFSLFYLILFMVCIKRYTLKTTLIKLTYFGIIIIIIAGLTAVILYPTGYFLLTKYAEDATVLSGKADVFIQDLYNQFFIGQNRGIMNSYPYLYCGLPSLLLLPFYFFNKKIIKKEKLVWVILLFLLIASCLIPGLYLFWHCFDAPDGFAFRFAFLISFVVCVMACRQSEYLVEIKLSKLFILIVINTIIYFACIFIQPKFQLPYKFYPEGTILYLVINIIFMLVYFVWLIIFDKYNNEKHRTAIVLIIFLVGCSEAIFNGYSAYFKTKDYNPTNYSDSYRLWEKMSAEVIGDIRNDNNGFYRIDSLNDYIVNGAVYNNYNGISSFSNLENYEVRKAVGKLGLLTSTRCINSIGLTDFTRMIFSVAYTINNIDFGDHRFYTTDNEQHAVAYRNNYCLSLGFIVDSKIKNFSFEGTNQFENINNLASAMINQDVNIYDLYDSECEFTDLGISIINEENGKSRYQLSEADNNPNGLLVIYIPGDERDACIQFDYGVSMLDYSAPIIVDIATGEWNYDDRISASFIKNMSLIDGYYAIGILMTDEVYDNVYAPKEIHFAYYNYDEFLNVYDELKDKQMEVLDYGNGWVDGHIDVNEDGKVLFTSIPYDEGWEIKVNGIKTEPLQLLDGAFIGLDLPRGNYDIEFRYHVPGLKIGCLITLISLLLMIGLLIINPQIKTEVRPERNHNKSKESKGNNEEFKDVNDPQEILNSK